MNSESTSNIQRTQSSKPTSYKRAHRAKRPVLVTEQERATRSEGPGKAAEEAQPATQVAVEEQPGTREEAGNKRGPRFFSSVGKAEKVSDQPKADPIAARLARALRGKSVDAPKENEAVKEKKAATTSARSGGATASTRPKSGFKMKYIWGMMIYLLIADFLGVWITDFMKSRGLDAVVFTISTFQASRSTLVFLALLIIILVLMARFDLIPRSLGAAMNGSSPAGRNAPSSKSKAPTFDSRESQPTIKQGVQGANDDLYREYRQNQRYFQKRDRKR
jgi:hypothetical protein